MTKWISFPALLLVVSSGVACATGQSTSTVTTPQRTSDVSTQSSSQPEQVTSDRPGEIPVGQEMDVRLNDSLSSETSTVEMRFEATTVVDLTQNGRVIVPAGSVVSGIVRDVKKAGRVDRSGSLTLAFDSMRVRGRDVPIRANATQIFESGGIREEGGTAGVGAGVGGVIGGILGGVKGAILGAVIGAGGAIAATDGKDISLPAGSIVRIRMDSPARVGGEFGRR